MRGDKCHWKQLYKRNGLEVKMISLFLVLGAKILLDMFYLWELELQACKEVEGLPWEENPRAIVFWFLVCGPFAARRSKDEE